MSYRERKSRREMAAAASARFAELTQLLTEQATLRVIRPALMRQLRTGGCDFADDLRGTVPEVIITYLAEGGCPPALAGAWAAELDEREADLAARIASYGDDPGVIALAEAAATVGQIEL